MFKDLFEDVSLVCVSEAFDSSEWWMKEPDGDLPDGLRTSDQIIEALPKLSPIQQLWLDLSLHAASNKMINSPQRMRWKATLDANTRSKLPWLRMMQTGKPMTRGEYDELMASMRYGLMVHTGYATGRWKITSNTGNKHWHLAWIDVYKGWIDILENMKVD